MWSGAVRLPLTCDGQAGFLEKLVSKMTPEGWRGVHQWLFFVKVLRGEEKCQGAPCGCIARWRIWREIGTTWWRALKTLLHSLTLYLRTIGSDWSMSIKELHEQISIPIQRVDWRRARLEQRYHRENVSRLSRQWDWMEKRDRFKKYYGSNCVEVGNKGESEIIVDSHVSRMETAQKVTLVTKSWRWRSKFKMRNYG